MALEWAQKPTDMQNQGTKKPQFNKSEGAKDSVLYSRSFVIEGAFYHEINNRKP